jgi:Leucine-rich repeat (LRR) protein
MSYNKLESLDSVNFELLPNLYLLYINNNLLKSLDAIRFPKRSKLSYLDISSNKIEHLREDLFVSLVQLRYLNISNNRIKFLKNEHFYYQTGLLDLDLRKNNITKIADKLFFGLKSIINIYISMANLSIEDKCNIKNSINSNFKKINRKILGIEYYTSTNLIAGDVKNGYCELFLFYLNNFILLDFKTENDITSFWGVCSTYDLNNYGYQCGFKRNKTLV